MDQTKWCPLCEEDLPLDEFYIATGKPSGLSSLCIYHNKKAEKRSRDKRRIIFLAAMGGKCEQCGFDDPRALQTDHINGGGTAEQRIMGNATARFYAKVLANRSDYQLLCANCNTIKKIEMKEATGPRHITRRVLTERPDVGWVPGKPKIKGRPKKIRAS